MLLSILILWFGKLHVFIIVSIFIPEVNSHLVGDNPHHLREVLDTEGRFQLEWIVNWNQKKVTFHITAQTTGYVGFGLSQNGKMTGADIIIGGVDSRGRSYFGDYYAVSNQTPLRDPSQDWYLLSAQENGTHTMISFARAFDTCDPQDYAITEDKISLIWALGSGDKISYHYTKRGIFHVYLLHPDYTPSILTEPATGTQLVLDKNDNVDTSVTAWTINREMAISPQETTYWCTMHRSPTLPEKNHLIGFNVRIHTESSRRHVHHLVLLHCRPPPGRTARSVFEPFVGGAGEECIIFWQQSTGQIPTQYCTEFTQLWANGGRAHFHPPHIGFPLESEGYYMLQVHFDNPTFISNARVNMSLDMFYTEKIRPNEGGFFSVRHNIPGLPPSLLIPPNTVDHQIRGICGGHCTRRMIPTEGIFIYGGLLHTHNAGRKLRIRHFRNNRELPFIASDENYSFGYQQMRNFPFERRVLPGDHVIAECVYDSTSANGTVVGGMASSQEMCTMDFIVYKRLADIHVCSSEIRSVQDRRYFLAGVENVTWSGSQIQYIVDPPHHLAGLTVTDISDKHVDWNAERREDLERYHFYHPHVNTQLDRIQILFK